MTLSQLENTIDFNITNKTEPQSISPATTGTKMKEIAQYAKSYTDNLIGGIASDVDTIQTETIPQIQEQLENLEQGPGVPLYSARLYQASTSNPTTPRIFENTLENTSVPSSDPNYLSVNFIYEGVGQYSIQISVGLGGSINGYNYDVSFSDNKVTTTGFTNGAVAGYSFTKFYFETRDSSGTLTNGLLNFTNVYIKQYA